MCVPQAVANQDARLGSLRTHDLKLSCSVATATSAQAQELLPFLRSVPPESPVQNQALEMLKAWDGILTPDSAASAIYEAWYAQLYDALIGDDVGGDMGKDMVTRTNPTLLASILLGNEKTWCDDVLTPAQEDCTATARVALDKALKDLGERMGKNMAKWRWGDIHRMQFPHNPFSQVSFLKPLFHRSTEVGGDAFTVNPAPFALSTPYDSQHLSSYREIIDLADLTTARFIQTTGQSGNPLSKHYDDLMPLWRAVEYVPMYWEKEKLKADGVTFTLTLEPSELTGK